jgi:hypothetical protein
MDADVALQVDALTERTAILRRSCEDVALWRKEVVEPELLQLLQRLSALEATVAKLSEALCKRQLHLPSGDNNTCP